MSKSCKHLLTIPFAFLVAVGVHADLLPISNPSFEEVSRPLEVGEQSNGAGGAGVQVGMRFPFVGGEVEWDNPVEVPGWRTRLRQDDPEVIIYAGVLNPPLMGQGQPFMTGQDGQYIAAAQAAPIQQTLNIQLQPNTRYELSFLAGIGLFDPDYAVFVGLLASPDLETFAYQGAPNVITLARTQSVNPPPDAAGTMLRYSIEYTSAAELPAELVGRYVAISAIGSDGTPRVCFDDFRLDATPVPEPAAGLILLAGTLLLRRRAGRVG